MILSAAHHRAYLVAALAEAYGNLLANKPRGTNDEIHSWPPLRLHPNLRIPRFPFRVQFRDGRADGEAPSVDREVLEFVGDEVAVLSFLRRDSGFVHFF